MTGGRGSDGPAAAGPSEPGGSAPPAGHAHGALRQLLDRLRPEWFRLGIVAMLGVGAVGFFVAGPSILGNATNVLFDGLFGGRLAGARHASGAGVDFTRLGRLLGLAALVYLLGAVLNWAQGYVMAGIAQRTGYGLRQAVEDKLGRLPLRYFDSHPHGDILSRVTNDLDNLTSVLQQGLNQFLTSALTVLGIIGAMFWISPLLAVASLITIPLSIAMTFGIARRSKTQFAVQWNQTGRLNSLVEETHTGHALVSVFGQRQLVIEDFARRNQRLYEASFRAQFLSGVVQPAVQFLGNINYVVIAALGGVRVATGMLSLGAVQAFIQYSRQFTTPISQVASQLNQIQSGLASAQRVFDFLGAAEETAIQCPPAGGGVARLGLDPADPWPGGPVPAAGRVRFEHVSFRYDPATPLIEDFTLEAAPGQTVAIVGPSGAGKTTVVNLLMRFYEIGGGRILLDGTDYRDLGRDQVRRCFGMVLQDTWLFAGTIQDNIAYGREGATDDDVRAAARAACADQFVRTLPAGYRTVLDADTSNISAGQKQLLTIARAFLANPGILILDEATSNVDTRTESLIQKGMARLRYGRTSFVIAHRLSTIRNADTIVVMNAGEIVEQGGHEDLLRRHGLYRDLYNSQFAGAPLS